VTQQQSPIIVPPGLRQVGLEQPEPNPHLAAGWWQASCPTCGSVLVEGRHQDRVEGKATRTPCPVCVEPA
jgi:hypothetical protein